MKGGRASFSKLITIEDSRQLLLITTLIISSNCQ